MRPLTTQVPLVSQALRSVRGAMLGVGMFSAVVNILMLTGPIFMLQVYDRVLTSRSLPTLVVLTLLVFALFAFMGVLDLVRGRVLSRVGLMLDEKLRAPAFDAVIRQQLVRQGQGDGQQPLRDLDTLRQFLAGQGPIALFDLPWMPIYLAVVFLLHPLLGIVATAGGILVVISTLLTEVLTKGPTRRATEELSRRNAWTEASRRNAESIRALGMGKTVREEWTRNHRRTMAAQLVATDVATALSATTKAFRLFQQSLMLAVGAYLVIEGSVTAGVMIAASIISARALAPVELAISQWRGFIQARQAYDRLSKVLVTEPTLRTELPKPSRVVAVRDLHVAPPGTRSITLSGITLTLNQGQGLAVIGPSAAGKSTFARALVGLWPAVRGEVRLDGATLDQWNSDDLGAAFGYLPQTVELFDGTVAENIGRFDPDRTDAAVIAAAQVAGAHEMIVRLPEGYDTRIGDAGVTLSAGQRQRIGLARALYKDPFLVVLDEPNANLDAEGEMALVRAIRAVRARGGVCVVMAHRPSALAEVDQVLVLREGRQVAFGPKEEVLKKTLANPEVASRIVERQAAAP